MQASALYHALEQHFPAPGAHPEIISTLDPAAPAPEVGAYTDATYLNYKPLGLSLCYEPTAGNPGAALAASSDTGAKSLSLAHIDIYNPPTHVPARARRKQAYAGYSVPRLPIRFAFATPLITLPPRPAARVPPGAPVASTTKMDSAKIDHTVNEPLPTTLERSKVFEVVASTTARDFVSHFGEPTKKGEGQAGYVPPFMEWDGLEIADEVDEGAADGGGDGGEQERDMAGAGGGKEQAVKVVKVGIMVELLDPGVPPPGGSGLGLGMGAPKGAEGGLWDRAGEWKWVGLKVFRATCEAERAG